jgi:hypothetical protein
MSAPQSPGMAGMASTGCGDLILGDHPVQQRVDDHAERADLMCQRRGQAQHRALAAGTASTAATQSPLGKRSRSHSTIMASASGR